MNICLKRDQVYKEIKDNILSGKYAEGSRLPIEYELAQQYNVARGTIRAALKQLAEEHLLKSITGKGSFVCGKVGKTRPVITFLLPCPDYMTRSDNFLFRNRQIIEGLMQRALELNCKVETVAVSPSNSYDDMDYRQLEHLLASSRLIISSWYYPLFDFFKKLKCRVLFYGSHNIRLNHPFSLIPHEMRPSHDWLWLTHNIPGAFELAVDTLYQDGCRKIAIASNWLDQPLGVVTQGYRDGMKKYQLEEYKMVLNDQPGWPTLRQLLVTWHERDQFDGLILCPRPKDVPDDEIYCHKTLGLPHDVKIMLTNCVPEQSLKKKNLPMIYFDYTKIGGRSVDELLTEPFVAQEKILQPHLCTADPIVYQMNAFQNMIDIF